MKKVLSFVLVLSMILGSFGMAFAAPADVVGKDYEDAVNALVELGVIAGYKDGTFKPENVVTRAEAATFIVKAMGLADYAVEKSTFSDMAGHWADPFVAYAASLGFVKGNTDGTFAPDATVTSDQMITMLVQAVGYDAKYMVGGYPGAFVNQAKALGMLDGVKSGSAGCTRADVATMLFNTLDVQFVRYTVDGALDETAMGTVDNMLKRLDASAYDKGNTITPGAFFVVDGDEDATINVMEYQGAYLNAYENADGDLIAVNEVKTVFLEGKFNAAGTKFETTDEVEYTVVNGTAAAVKFVNGKASTGAIIDYSENVKVAAEINGVKMNQIRSVAQWTVNNSAIVDEADLDAIEAETPTLLGCRFVEDKYEEIDLKSFVLVGAESLEAIKEDDVVYVYANEDGISRIEVGTEVVTGEVAKISTTEEKITVNGKVYEFSGESHTKANVEVSGKYDFYLDAAGKIYEVDAIEVAAANYGIVLTKANGSTGLRGEDALLKLVMADGKAKTFVINADAIEDGKIASVSAITNAAIVTGTAVKYNVNEAGELDKVEIVAMADSEKATITKKGTFDGYKIAADVVIMTQEGLATGASIFSDDADVYGAATLESVLGKEDVVAHYALKNGEIVFMVMDATGTSEDVTYGFAVKVEEISDGDNGSDYEVTILSKGKEAMFLADNATDYVVGTTLYAISVDADGYAVDPTGDNDKSDKLTVSTTSAITKVTDKVYVGSEVVMTLDDAAVVYKMVDGKATVGTKADVKVADAQNDVVFYDVDEDKIADIVLVL